MRCGERLSLAWKICVAGQTKEERRSHLKFCQYLWEEQKASQQFTFDEFNKDIIEALKDLSSDTADVHFIESEELWFLRGMCKEYKEMSQVGG